MSDPTPPGVGGAFLSPPIRGRFAACGGPAPARCGFAPARLRRPRTPPQLPRSPALNPPHQKAPPLYLRRSLFFCSLFTYFPSPSRSIFASLIKAEVLYSTSTSVMPSVWISSVSEPR